MSHPAQHLAVPIRAAAVLDTRASLLFGASVRRRSLLLPIRWPETARREDLLARHLDGRPGPITVAEVMALPGMRLCPGQEHVALRLMRGLGYSAGKGNVLWSRPDYEAGADRPRGTHARGRVHPAIVAALPRITALLDAVPEGASVTEAAVAEACGVGLVSHHRRAVGRQLRRMGWRPVSPGSHRLVRGGA